MVRSRGLEPPHRFRYKHLKLARLPIPPRPHGYKKGYIGVPICLQLTHLKQHPLTITLAPQASASANSATSAGVKSITSGPSFRRSGKWPCCAGIRLQKDAFKLRSRFDQIPFAHNIIPVEDAPRLQSTDLHHDALRNTGTKQIPSASAPQIVEQLGRAVARPQGTEPATSRG